MLPWIRPLLLTLQLMGWCVLIAAVLGLLLAWSASNLSPRRPVGRLVRLYFLCSTLTCLAIPMILHATAWESTAGKFGWMTFSQTGARTYTGLGGWYSGMIASAWIHGLVGTALVALATWYGTSRIPAAVVDQGRLDGGRVWNWWRIRLPIAMPWVGTALLATGILAATEMTVVDLYGVRTLADEYYLFHSAQPSMISILMVLVLPAIFLIAAISLWVMHRPRHFQALTVGQMQRETGSPSRSHPFAVAVVIGLSTLLFIFPLAGLVVKAGHEVIVSPGQDAATTVGWSFSRTVQTLARAPLEFRREYAWTVLLAVGVAAVCLPVAWIAASIARPRFRLGRFFDFLSIVAVLIPGPIVGLVIVHLFAFPIPGLRRAYNETLVPTGLALMFRALPVAYWILRAGYRGLDQPLWDTARLDFSWGQRMWRIDRPLLAKPLLIAALAAAVVASGDVPATLPVLPPGVVTVGTRLFGLLHSGARYQEAALAFWYIVVIVVICMLAVLGCRPAAVKIKHD
ncbi:iron ABC transporter permease [Roseiconus nitratireducens]|uniref:Iron ABC transporter permease n=1 Tax=Roseiconus nitratireducens TaxID=2605748 RepID=A0A5M6D455_9BACT|nr:iron ABC transporter permease [Roseiconus nitratireducens]KAA5541370.1 iron ABC transporter permease [Roseiconus nitratireducens]